MEQSSKIQRSEEWQKIYEIVKQLPVKNESGCDAMDRPSAATELEALFLKLLALQNVTASYFDKIQKGFKKLQEDCTEVSLVGFCQKEEIPDEAHREEFEEEFDHEYQLTQTDGWDEASFWGDIYLQLDGTLYMRFYVHG